MPNGEDSSRDRQSVSLVVSSNQPAPAHQAVKPSEPQPERGGAALLPWRSGPGTTDRPCLCSDWKRILLASSSMGIRCCLREDRIAELAVKNRYRPSASQRLWVDASCTQSPLGVLRSISWCCGCVAQVPGRQQPPSIEQPTNSAGVTAAKSLGDDELGADMNRPPTR
jgi:hypothetical protein